MDREPFLEASRRELDLLESHLQETERRLRQDDPALEAAKRSAREAREALENAHHSNEDVWAEVQRRIGNALQDLRKAVDPES